MGVKRILRMIWFDRVTIDYHKSKIWPRIQHNKVGTASNCYIIDVIKYNKAKYMSFAD